MKRIKLVLSAATFLLIGALGFAQNVRVGGTVKDESGNPLPGAAVFVQGTTQGAVTNFEGEYTLNAPANGSLTVSIIGYKEQTVPVNGRTAIDFVMVEDAQVLEDVVVVAYGTQKREAVTGSVSSVKGETLASAPVTSVENALSGKLAGVAISANSGQPGANTYIRIRGTGSINASNAPLWVIDGIPVVSGPVNFTGNEQSGSALNALNPNDIESITVLKDAAAAAAYGSRAANGVILVTTKSGREGKAQFTARAKFGANWLQSDSGFRMMNAEELLTYQRDAIINAGMDPDDPSSSYYRPWSLLNGKLSNAVNEFSRVGTLQEYEVSARGGNARAKFYSSFTYQKSQGVFYGIDYNKLQGRVNTSYKLLNNLEMGVRFNLAYTKQSDVPMQSLYSANPLWSGMGWLPWDPTTNDEGLYVTNVNYNGGENARASATYDDKWDQTWHINGTVNLRWTPIKHLDLETKNSMETFFVNSRHYYSPMAHRAAYADQLDEGSRQILQLTTSNTATYANIFGGYHSVRAVVGQEAMRYTNKTHEMYTDAADANMPYFLSSLDQSHTEIQYGETNETMLSFFGIADYNYDNRYFAQATVRADGSSLFGADNKWGTFWSVSASWNATNEKFLKNVKNVDLLKLRLSYGVNGNNGISAYQAYGLYSAAIYNGISGYLPSQLENRQLSWERNKTWNVGIDFGFFKNRLNGSIDVYSRKTVDLLLTKQIPQTTGFSSIFTNVGSMKNDGVELLLNYDIISKPDLLWTIGGNVAYNKTTILDLGGDEFIGTNTRQVVGRGMYTYYLYDYYGVNPSNGEPLWVTEDGSLTNQYAKARRYYAGSPEPKWVGGFNTSFQWKGLSLSAFFEFKAGHKVLLWNENHYLHSDGAQMDMNQFASATNYWKKPGDTGCDPKPVAGNTSGSSDWYNDRWLQDASYLRIKDVTLSYTLPQNLTKKIFINNLRIYVSGLNLYCFNGVDYWDPEQGVSGITAGAYPLTKSFVGGIEITF
ncbi:MAG: TonB-dependent receptor [Bacteroidales bacterium]|jgi:TonB-linked SusC/RagA family outer membrane protein|nr:TonB-dependent receptor [Bacteroidales bacterium]